MTATMGRVAGADRLLGHATTELAEHESLLGSSEWRGDPRELIALVRDAGLTGRGGAGFPTWRKLAAVAAGDRAVVIANGAEGEPASAKDRTLLHHAPHLVLDGLELAATAVGATRAYVYVAAEVVPRIREVLAQRAGRAPAGALRRPVEVVEAPHRFLAGEESAVIACLEGRPALPRDKTRLVVESGLRGAPTLVQNVETLAHLALIARYGPAWFRQWGTPEEPGTFLATVGGAVATPGVHEIPYGFPLGHLIGTAGGALAPLQALLIGGYHGTWVSASPDTPLSRGGLRAFGATPGAGVIVALPVGVCGLAESARMLSYLAEQSAGQCGPCLNGLPRLADTFARLARRERDPHLPAQVERLATLVSGRGACHHPDGSVRLVASAMRTFAPEVYAHLEGRCSVR